jgi:hypothetical protein
MDISDSDSVGQTTTKHRNRDGSGYHWICMYVIGCDSCWSVSSFP